MAEKSSEVTFLAPFICKGNTATDGGEWTASMMDRTACRELLLRALLHAAVQLLAVISAVRSQYLHYCLW